MSGGFGWNLKEVLEAHKELAEVVAANPNSSFSALGSQLVDFLFFSNFIAAHTTYNKDREQSSMTLKQVTQTNKRFLALIEDRKSGIHTVKSLEKALNEPVRFITQLRAVIAAQMDEKSFNTKESRVWTGIAKNLRPLCLEEERETLRRTQENKLFQLELRILDLVEKIHKPGRYLICQASLSVSSTGRTTAGSPTGTLRNGTPKSKLADIDVVLMNDMLLFLKKSKRHKGMFEFRSMHPLTQLLTAESGSASNELRVVFLDAIFSLRFDTPAEAEKWLSEVRQHIPNSGEMTERSDRSPQSTRMDLPSPSNATTPTDRDARSDKKYLSETEEAEAEAKKRKKRATSNLTDQKSAVSFSRKNGLDSASSTGTHSTAGHTSNPSLAPPASAQLLKRTSTESKRSKFTKSLSVSTITSEISPAPRSPSLHMRRKSVKKQPAESADALEGSLNTVSGSNCSTPILSSKSFVQLSTPEEPKKKKRTETSPNSAISVSSSSISHSSSGTNLTSDSGAHGNGNTTVASENSTGTGSTSPGSSSVAKSGNTQNGPVVTKLDLSNPSIRSKAAYSPSSHSSNGNAVIGYEIQQVQQQPQQTLASTSQKYLLSRPHIARGSSGALDHSSDYEESEDEPARHVSRADREAFFKPPSALPRDAIARNLQSSSIRELRSGSMDDMSAREHFVSITEALERQSKEQQASSPSTSHADTDAKKSEAKTSSRAKNNAQDADEMLNSEDSVSADDAQTDAHQPSSASMKALDVEVIVSTIKRMESDLANLKRALASVGVSF